MAKGKKRLKAWLWHRLMADGPQSARELTDILNTRVRKVRNGTYVSKDQRGQGEDTSHPSYGTTNKSRKYEVGTIVDYYRYSDGTVKKEVHRKGEKRYYFSSRALKKGDDANVHSVSSILAGCRGNGGTYFRKVTQGRDALYEAIPLDVLVPRLKATNKPLSKFPDFIRRHVKESGIEW